MLSISSLPSRLCSRSTPSCHDYALDQHSFVTTRLSINTLLSFTVLKGDNTSPIAAGNCSYTQSDLLHFFHLPPYPLLPLSLSPLQQNSHRIPVFISTGHFQYFTKHSTLSSSLVDSVHLRVHLPVNPQPCQYRPVVSDLSSLTLLHYSVPLHSFQPIHKVPLCSLSIQNKVRLTACPQSLKTKGPHHLQQAILCKATNLNKIHFQVDRPLIFHFH